MRYRAHMNALKPAIPYLFLYDEDGSQSFNSTGAFHTWDLTKIISSDFTYPSDTNKVIMAANSSGFFKVTFECTFTGVGAGDMTTSIYKNGSELDGGKSIITFATNEYLTVTLTYIVYLEKNDYIQIFTQTSANSVSSIADTSRLIIEFIPMRGWDNSAGGKYNYKGGVLR